jgi:soluble cytochrome b562
MSTPPLSQATGAEHSEIMIKDVVQRVKCELSDAFDEKAEQPEFLWLQSWVAHMDLTLTINDNAGLSSGGSFTQYQKSALNTSAGLVGGAKTFPVVSQFFTVSVGANLSGQAVRTETVSFTVALDELKMWRNYINKIEANLPPEKRTCNFPSSMGLTGNLGLKEWVDSAFYPAEIKELKAGIHAASSGGKPAATTGSQATPAAKSAETPTVAAALRQIKDWQDAVNALQTATTDSSKTISTAAGQITAAQKAIKTKIDDAKQYKYVLESYLQSRYKKVSDLIDAHVKNANACLTFQGNLDKAKAAAKDLTLALGQLDPASRLAGANNTAYQALEKLMLEKLMPGVVPAGPATPAETVNGVAVAAAKATPPNVAASNFVAGSAKCATAIQPESADAAALPAVLPEQVNPPIDSLSHSLTFTINYGANVTPSWTLLQWKGPGTNGNFLSASGVRTHGLIIALGPRTGAPAIGPDALRLIQNQTVRSLNGQ